MTKRPNDIVAAALNLLTMDHVGDICNVIDNLYPNKKYEWKNKVILVYEYIVLTLYTRKEN